ncbi:glucosaminidase domain-containing protein [Paenibacillus thermotolerans]|uniref:glucosaminidase domain-containing protein n=1 Tax=Paenibacillus thermotolerans TaxID=3027807 RepID=UPI002368C248|nr:MULTISPECIES: glucosaminidase domain-containing protein [unclassified Paenibacillus]
MGNMLKLHMIASILCVTVLFTLGLDYGVRGNDNDDRTTSDLLVENDMNYRIEDYKRSNRIHAKLELEHRIKSKAQALAQASLPMQIAKEQTSDRAEAVTVNYEVTAYYLNVRSEPNSSSKILDVVSKGSILEVINPTDNGWLALKEGGFVHGKYAKSIDEEVQQVKRQEPVTILSAERSETARPEKPTSFVESDSGLTEEHIAKLFEGTALEGEGLEKAILDVEKNYGINSYFTIAVMKLESGHGKSRIAQNKNNLFGLNATGDNPYKKALSFETKGDSVQKFGHIISEHYLDKGLTSIDKVAQKYCGANPKWPSLVKGIMKSDYKKIAA